MVRTRVGYAGGTEKSPSYYALGGHSESVQVDYDPTRITYSELLDVFWDSHNPEIESWSTQYKSTIFYHNKEQKRLAVESKRLEEARLRQKIYTKIVPAAEFYLAEGYHQKYYLRQVPELIEELTAIYPNGEGLIASTTAARLNGYVGGYGTLNTLKEQLNSYGLSEAGKEKLLKIAERGLAPGCAAR